MTNINSMKIFIVTAQLECLVSTEDEYKNTHEVKKGLRPNFLYKNHYHTGVISKCNAGIAPGESGTLQAKFILDEESVALLVVGDKIGIYEGPENKLAECNILEICEVEPLS
ncbi:hypothetical protein [uncultured Microbulbifer sp.]|uniref:hypothetical protein n=1 Tax=uncultured Microbulbifer sp. TaxID=348147 RepID=UPI00260B0A5B|nr:hypothetical protein [uncultured Microbulbifer sp.]